MAVRWYTFLHHGMLVEPTWDVEECLTRIKAEKPTHEVPVRVACIKEVPVDRIPPALVAAGETYGQAWHACEQAQQARAQARWVYTQVLDDVQVGPARAQMRQVYDQEERAYYEALDAYRQAEQAYNQLYNAFYPELRALVRELVPDAPWDEERRCLVLKEKKG